MKKIRVYEELVPTILETRGDWGDSVQVSEDFYEKWIAAAEAYEQLEHELRGILNGTKYAL